MRGIALETEMQKNKSSTSKQFMQYRSPDKKRKKKKNKINKYNENKYVNCYY